MIRVPTAAFVTLALALSVLCAPAAFAEEKTDVDLRSDKSMLDGGRLYVGGAGGRMGNTPAGGGAVVGYQWITGHGPHTATWLGLEVLGVQTGPGFVPLLTGDFGLKLVAFPRAFLRPYFTANLGVTMLLILPLPSLAVGVGAAVPIGALQVDLGLHYRRVFNIFDANNPLDIATLQVGLEL